MRSASLVLLLLSSFDNQFLTKQGLQSLALKQNLCMLTCVPQHGFGETVETRRSTFLFRRTTCQESVLLWTLLRYRSIGRRRLAVVTDSLQLETDGPT